MRALNHFKIVIPLITLLISGCSNPGYFESWNSEILTSAYWNKGTLDYETNMSRQKIERSLASNDLEMSQKRIVDSRLKKVPESQLDDLYTKTINRLLIEAEQNGGSGNPEKAGRLFKLAIDIYPISEQLQSTIDLTPNEIYKNMQMCADELMKNGLIAYRSGELESAINIWGEVGQFLPDHVPSQLAANTARQQLQSLKKITSNDTM